MTELPQPLTYNDEWQEGDRDEDDAVETEYDTVDGKSFWSHMQVDRTNTVFQQFLNFISPKFVLDTVDWSMLSKAVNFHFT